MKVTVTVEDDDKKIIYTGDDHKLNIALYKLLKLTFSEVDFTLHHTIDREFLDLETFNERKTIKRLNHNFNFEIDEN